MNVIAIKNLLEQQLKQRILVMDGAMGTAIQALEFKEADYRGERFKDHPIDLKGNYDVLVLTLPEAIKGIHLEYLRAGADIIGTNTFTANGVSQSDFATQDLIYELTRTIYENRNRVVEKHAAGRAIHPVNVVRNTGTEFHPGAVRYYREIGIWPEEETPN